jgi:3D (Asp-Asp-Asp) domain-containing protein
MWKWASLVVVVALLFTPLAGQMLTDSNVNALQQPQEILDQQEDQVQEEAIVLDVMPQDDIVYTQEGYDKRMEQKEQERQEKEKQLLADAVAYTQAGDKEKTQQAVEEMGLTYMGDYKLTAYCPCEICCGKSAGDAGYGITASGDVATEGVTIAMEGLPFGTRVFIEGVGERVVQDRGSGIKGNRIDIFCSTHERCFMNPNYVKTAKVWLLEMGDGKTADERQ